MIQVIRSYVVNEIFLGISKVLTRLDNEIGFMEQGLRLRSQRQQVLATNIANADTPNYKAQDFDFKSAMQSAISGSTPASQMLTTDARHMGGTNAGVTLSTQAIKPTQNSADGNTVDMNLEQTKFTENALQYEALVSLINSNFKNINSVMQG
jgi:flagellar basal-body rod protein FlgB